MLYFIMLSVLVLFLTEIKVKHQDDLTFKHFVTPKHVFVITLHLTIYAFRKKT